MTATIITSVVTAGTNNHATVSEEANAVATDCFSAGIVGAITNTTGVAPTTGGFSINQDATPDMGILIGSGVAYVGGTPSGQDPQMLRCRMSANYTNYTINANASGSTKYDWVYLSMSAANAANPSAAADNVITLFTSRSTSNTADNGTPPAYGLLLAVVTVSNGASSIVNANITDKRVIISTVPAGSVTNTALAGGITPSKLNLGNCSFNGYLSSSQTTNSSTPVAITGATATITVYGGALMIVGFAPLSAASQTSFICININGNNYQLGFTNQTTIFNAGGCLNLAAGVVPAGTYTVTLRMASQATATTTAYSYNTISFSVFEI